MVYFNRKETVELWLGILCIMSENKQYTTTQELREIRENFLSALEDWRKE